MPFGRRYSVAAHDGIDLVTGGAGFIGSHLVDHLLARADGSRVRQLRSRPPRQLEAAERKLPSEIVEGDVAEMPRSMRRRRGVERIFHLAARADIVPSIQEPEAYFRANVDGTFAVLEAARATASSASSMLRPRPATASRAVYPTPEMAPADLPLSLCADQISRRAIGHALGAGLSAAGGFGAFLQRLWPACPHQRNLWRRFRRFPRAIAGGKPLTVVGDGEQTRDFTFVSDVVDALLAVAESDKVGEIYNVGSGKPVSVNELVRLLGSPPIRAYSEAPRRAGLHVGRYLAKSATNSAGSRRSALPTACA